jgi:hypothetical protein
VPKEVGAMAGLAFLRIINEPVGAALTGAGCVVVTSATG